MAYAFLAGVGLVEAYTGNQLIFRSKSLTDEGWSLGITAEDIRGGAANALLGRYFHDSQLEATLTDALFDLQYVALNVGATVEGGSENTYLQTERVVVGAGGTITPSVTPKEWLSLGTVGWYKEDNAEAWNAIEFENGVATVPSLTAGTEICVRFNGVGNVTQITVPSDFIPSTVTLYMTMPLFAAASASEQDVTNATKLGEVQLLIPRFQFSGSMDFSITSSGAATSSLSGMALAVLNGEGCEDTGYYAVIKEVKFSGNWYDGLERIAVSGAEKEIAVGDSTTLQVYGQYADGRVGRIGNDKLTFTSDSAYASVTNAGVVTGDSAGTSYINIVVTDKNTVEGFAKIVVSE